MPQLGVAVITEMLSTPISPTTQDRLRLQVHPSSAHIARRAAYSWAVERRFPDPAPGDFATVTDELTSNAIKAMSQVTPERVILYPYGTHFTVAFGLFAQQPCVRVWDGCPLIPDLNTEPELDEFAESGRGLIIVRALAAAFAFLPRETGKTAIAVMVG